MDKLISAIALSAGISPEDKEALIGKIMCTASLYYKNPFYDKVRKKVQFNPYSEYSRLYSRSCMDSLGRRAYEFCCFS